MAKEEKGVLSVEVLQSVTQNSQALNFALNDFADAVNTANERSQEGGMIWISHLEFGG